MSANSLQAAHWLLLLTVVLPSSLVLYLWEILSVGLEKYLLYLCTTELHNPVWPQQGAMPDFFREFLSNKASPAFVQWLNFFQGILFLYFDGSNILARQCYGDKSNILEINKKVWHLFVPKSFPKRDSVFGIGLFRISSTVRYPQRPQRTLFWSHDTLNVTLLHPWGQGNNEFYRPIKHIICFSRDAIMSL